MEKSKGYLEARAKRRLQEIETKLSKYNPDEIVGNALLKETIKILEKERKELFEFLDKNQTSNVKESELISEYDNQVKYSTPNIRSHAEKLILNFYKKVKGNNWKKAWNIFVELDVIINSIPNSKSAEYNGIFSTHESIRNIYYPFYEKVKDFKKRNRKKRQELVDKTRIIDSENKISEKQNQKSENNNSLSKKYFAKLEHTNQFLNRSKNLVRKNKFKIGEETSDFKAYIKKLSNLYDIMNETEKTLIEEHERNITSLKMQFEEIIQSLNLKNVVVTSKDKNLRSLEHSILSNRKKQRKVTFFWHDIRFSDGYISFSGWAGFKYPFESSRAIFSIIKDSVIVPSDTSFVVTFDMNKSTIEEVIGLEILDEVFEILE